MGQVGNLLSAGDRVASHLRAEVVERSFCGRQALHSGGYLADD